MQANIDYLKIVKGVIMKTKIFKKCFLCFAILFAALFFVRCNTGEPEIVNPIAEGTKILFIGNSLTFYNDVPGIFANFANIENKQLFIGTSLIGGASLYDHSLSVQTTNLIYQYDWDYVILQGSGHSAAFPQYFGEVLQSAKLLKNFILSNKEDTKIIYFNTFSAPDSVEAYFSGLTFDEYQAMIDAAALEMADSLDCMVAPAGVAWRTVYEDRPDIRLYDFDGVHPSAAGSYLEAYVYYATIFQESCEGIEYYADLSTSTAAYLQQTGSATVLNRLSQWRIPPLTNYLY